MKYLNAVLTVIAVCLVLITFSVTGLIPSAHAGDRNQRFPVNADGSLRVRFVQGDLMHVSIDAVNGSRISGSEFPVTAKSPLDINIEEINGSSTFITPIRVKVEK
jgi:hypothetical protein